MFKYQPSRYVLKRVFDFSEQRIEGSKTLYSRRGEKNVEKMKTDILTGAIAEYAVYNYFKSKGLKCSRPDLKIYEKRKKSFDADLTAYNFYKEKINVHVKSQTTASVKRYKQSWLFQRSDSLVKSPEVNDVMVFTNVCTDTWECSIVGFVHPRLVCEMSLWGECKVPYYRHSKVAIYLTDLEPYGIVLEDIDTTVEI